MNVYVQTPEEHVDAVKPSTTICIVEIPLLVSPAVAVSITEVPGVSCAPDGDRASATVGGLLSAESVAVLMVDTALAESRSWQYTV